MRRTAGGGALLFCLMLLGCARQPGKEFYPFSNGARWEYSVEFSSPFAGVQRGKCIIRIEGTEKIRGNVYFKKVTVFSGIPGAEPETSFHRVTANGVYKIPGAHRDMQEYLEVPFPLKVGTAWSEAEPEGRIDWHVEIEETAELPERQYEKSLKIRFHGQNATGAFDGFEYDAPGIGTVRQVLHGKRYHDRAAPREIPGLITSDSIFLHDSVSLRFLSLGK